MIKVALDPARSALATLLRPRCHHRGRLQRYGFVFVLAFWAHYSIPAFADTVQALPQATAEYSITYMGIEVGHSRLDLEATSPKRYRLRLQTRAVGPIQAVYPLRHQTETHLSMTGHGLRPIRYMEETRLWGPPEKESIRFHWRKRNATVVLEEGTFTLPLPAGPIQDRVSLVPAIMHDLARGKFRDSYTLFDGKRLHEYPMSEAGRSTLVTAVGELEVIRVERPVGDKNEVTQAWLAPTLGVLTCQGRTSPGRTHNPGSVYPVAPARAVGSTKAEAVWQ